MKRDEYKMTQQVDTTDYKQKYEQALKVASQWHKDGIGDVKTIVECIFPELKESEDERIIKEIISIVKSYRENCITEGNHRFDDCIAWLEKQGEQKPWREEDENGLSDALWAIQQARTIAKDENDMGNLWYAENWLNSLKDKVQPQQKQEWSEEDEKIMKRVDSLLYSQCAIHGSEYEELHKWLKSLKPQNHWKPSEEQMQALFEAKLASTKNREYFLGLLYEDLKKL